MLMYLGVVCRGGGGGGGEDRCLNFCYGLHPHPFFWYASRERSGKSVHLLLAANISCAGPFYDLI